jgi:polysaccharide biosynthesis/export protein
LLCIQTIQELPAQQTGEPQTADISPDYRVGPGDSLYISAFGMNEFNQTIRVSNSGKIHVPYLGILKVADMTCAQIQAEIVQGLIGRKLLKEPWVQVRVVEYRAHPAYILGEVMQPGQFLIRDDMYVMDLITLAQGFNEVASPIGYLYRRTIEAPDSNGKNATGGMFRDEAIEINFQQLYDGSRPELNVKLRGGDVLYCPQRRVSHFFVVGDVNSPGAIELPFGQQVLASQAVAKAGGPYKTAKMSKGMLMRYDKEGKQQEQPVDFKAILLGKKADFAVMPNDIIFIPGSSAKTVGYGILGALPTITQGMLLTP